MPDPLDPAEDVPDVPWGAATPEPAAPEQGSGWDEPVTMADPPAPVTPPAAPAAPDPFLPPPRPATPPPAAPPPNVMFNPPPAAYGPPGSPAAPGWGAPPAAPAWGAPPPPPPPGYGQPGYAPPAYGQPAYGQPGYGAPAGPPPGYGQPPPPPGAGYGQGYANYGSVGYGYYQAPPATNGLAIASLVLGILGGLCYFFGGILGIIFGAVALKQIKETNQQGRGLAIAGIICGSVWVSILGIVLVAGLVGSR